MDTDQQARIVNLAYGGETILQTIDETATWAQRVNHLRDAITALPELTTQAFIRPTSRIALTWSDIDNIQKLDRINEAHIRYNRHLLTHYVPDAHGIQLLRDEHLTNAHDLTNWTITNLGHGRHLVEANDLIPWYSTPLPDPNTVAQARRDFGPMILTPETINAKPPPWPRTHVQ